MQQEYPYAELNDAQTNWVSATKGQRIGNYLIDLAAFYLSFFLLGVTLAIIGQAALLDHLQGPMGSLIGVVALLTYYFLLEVTTGRTLGKLLTRTRVVMEDGSELTTSAVFIRTICRLIPFEAFSMLSSERGWHDSISKTRVVQVPR